MNYSIILTTATRYLLPLMLLFSIFLLMRGHNDPGGGFVGGLMAASSFALYTLAYGLTEAKQLFRIDPRTLIGVGLLVSMSSGLFSLLVGQPFMTAFWSLQEIPVLGKAGTPLLFDVGVYLVVLGITLTIIFALADLEEEA
ncbi:MAG: Na+/H+ antiporter subunit B [Gloeobacterales cyanobacterium]